MKLLIIYAHPDENSFTAQVLKNFTDGARKAGHSVEVSDLYRMGFQSEMSLEEYRRESTLAADAPISPDVQAEQNKIRQADALVFIYPVWWTDCPAILKGWFDRVWTIGFAYGIVFNDLPMKPLKKALVIAPAGQPASYLKESGLADSMKMTMLRDRIGARALQKEMIILDNMNDRSEQHIAENLTIARLSGENF